MEAVRWGQQWLCGHDYELPWPQDMGDALPPLDVDRLCGALLSFPAATGLGWDKMHPRAWLRLGRAALLSLLHLFSLVEAAGRWPAAVGHVLVVLLAKAAGGFRPIGLFPSIIRVWMRIRLADAVVWQSLHERPWLFASAGKGAEVAAWRQAARSEQAASKDWHYGASLLDMIKAFERVPHDVLVTKAMEKGYSLFLLKASLAAYRLPRALVVQGVCSKLLVACRGVTAGAGHAVIELRLLLGDLWDEVHRVYHCIDITVYVDDATLEARGTARHVLRIMPLVLQVVVEGLAAVRMELGLPKCFVLASSYSFAKQLAQACHDVLPITATPKARSLGVGLAGGRSSASHVLLARLGDFRRRLGAFGALRRLAVDTARLLRSGGVAGLTYGEASVGVQPSLLYAQRTAAAKALGDRTVGGDLDLTLAVADGASGGMADPAFQAHLQPICAWARAVWDAWLPRADVLQLAEWAKRRLLSTSRQWRAVCGPATATVATLARLGWSMRDGVTLVTNHDVELDLTRDSPARVQELVKAAVREWRWARVAGRIPSLAAPAGYPELGPCWRPLARLLDPAVKIKGWNAQLRGALRSAVTNRQWPQQRKFKAGLVDDPSCRLCVAVLGCRPGEPGTPIGSLAHRCAECFCLKGLRQTAAPPDVIRHERDPGASPVKTAWITRALQPTLAYSVPPPAAAASFRWMVPPVGGLLHHSWTVYTDGSMLDGPLPLIRRTGWAFVALDDDGKVCAIARGVPPPWISTIFGAEVWAILQAVVVAPALGPIRIDCKAAVDLLRIGPGSSGMSRRVTAPVWASIFAALDDCPPEDLSWMPAHTVPVDVGRKRLGNGQLLTEADRRANDVADHHAKAAVEEHRVPLSVRSAITRQEHEVTAMAWWVARVTLEANQWGPDKLRDSDAAARRAGPRVPRRLRRRAGRDEIPTALGGHTLVPANTPGSRRWMCTVCRRAAMHRPTLAVTRCRGSVALRWASRATAMADQKGVTDQAHCLLSTGQVSWCFHCGANACTKAVLLARPCPGRSEGFLAQARQRLLLGLHPATRAPLHSGTVAQLGGALPRTFEAAVVAARASRVKAAGPLPLKADKGSGSRTGSGLAAGSAQPEPAWRTAMRARIAARAAAAAGDAPAPKRRRLTGKQPGP